MGKQFVSEPITAVHQDLPSGAKPDQAEPMVHAINEPQLPAAFRWRDEIIQVHTVRNRGRSTKVDRGDTYLKRHWFEFDTADGRVATVYYDRAAKRGTPHWWLYSLSS